MKNEVWRIGALLTLMFPWTSFLTTSEKKGLEKASNMRRNMVMASRKGPTSIRLTSPFGADAAADLYASMISTKNLKSRAGAAACAMVLF